ncbi:MAG: hypothetical protein HOQ11_03850 [Gemmatimonadaceae bacterium]|nr:hypothetical protein [Gemmatimonadaceae bacterium]NUQ92319.1 hypothetical protein [Gemmatimonadaceae bacterium]NUR19706.1 hypothetical protein [Gemmatimonadaceae bacterium]NUS96525.1 hypothetical protein [Gemmatimonadaceae bacterium]
MATGPKLDGAGNVKLVTIHEAQAILQRCHGIVEGMALDVKNSRPIAGGVQQLKRAATPLIGKLKGQFGMIADVVTAMLLAATRGGGDAQKVRGMREGIASVRTQLEIAEAKVLEKHSVEDKKHAESSAD